MKKILLYFLFSGSLGGFSQMTKNAICYHNTPTCMCRSGEVKPIEYVGQHYNELDSARKTLFQLWHSKPDTLHAELLLTYTTRRWGVAHSRDGYVVKMGDEVTDYLDNEYKPFPSHVTVWGWIKWEDRKKKRRR